MPLFTLPGLKTYIVIYFSDAHAPRGYSSFQHSTHEIHVAFQLSFVSFKAEVHLVFKSSKLQPMSKVDMQEKLKPEFTSKDWILVNKGEKKILDRIVFVYFIKSNLFGWKLIFDGISKNLPYYTE